MGRLALLYALLLLPGCFVSKDLQERTWDASAVEKLEVGKSTRADVLRLVGAPTEVIKLLDSDAYVYEHTVTKTTGMFLILFNTNRQDRQFDRVTVIVDRKGTVVAVGTRWAADRAVYGLPWTDTE